MTAADPESDDDFDETTLWEIANLLNTKDVPSKNSLLPFGRAEIIEDYDESESDSEENTSSKSTNKAPPMHLPIQPLSVSREISQLWAKDVTSAFSAVEFGLPEPESSAWKALVASSDNVFRSKPRTSDTLPILATRDLWTVPEVEVNVVSSSPSMWTTNEIIEQSSSQVPTPGTNQPNPMWSPPAERTENHKSGLFTNPAEGSVIRTTQAVPAAIKMLKTPRQTTKAVPKILSQHMWTPVQNSESPTEWISKSSVPMSRRSVSSPSPLWTTPVKVATVTVFGLFDLSMPRSDFRLSSLAPAAVNMICKPRKSLSPLSELTSSGLWNGCNKLPIEQDWISVSSVRPESPSVYSTTSSGSSSPASDSSSVASNSTKASSLWSSIGNVTPGSVSTWWEGKKSAPTSLEGEAKRSTKILRQQSFKQLAPLRESEVLASRDLWESTAPVLETPAKKFRKATTITKPLRHQYRSNAAVRADWEEALAQAILAGTPEKSLTRPFATLSDWESALAEAVALGQPTKFDPTVMHPVFFIEPLVSSSIDIHPAAIGYVTKRPAYDASVLHPVFFTESLVSNAKEVHPAALGHLANKRSQARGMWTSAPSSPPSECMQLWSKNAGQARDASMHSEEFSGHTVRKALTIKPLNLPVLSSSTFWQQPAQTAKQQRDWLTTAHAKRSSSRPAAVQRSRTNTLFVKDTTEPSLTHWLHKTSTTGKVSKQSAKVEKNDPASAALFINPRAEPWSRKRRGDASSNRIESAEMWRPSMGLPESPTNWLVDRRASRVEFRY